MLMDVYVYICKNLHCKVTVSFNLIFITHTHHFVVIFTPLRFFSLFRLNLSARLYERCRVNKVEFKGDGVSECIWVRRTGGGGTVPPCCH